MDNSEGQMVILSQDERNFYKISEKAIRALADEGFLS